MARPGRLSCLRRPAAGSSAAVTTMRRLGVRRFIAALDVWIGFPFNDGEAEEKRSIQSADESDALQAEAASGRSQEQREEAMSKPFDATLKDLAAIDAGGFLAQVDAPPALPVRLLNVDLSTVTTSADLVFGLGDPLQEVVHVDAQAGPDANKHRDVLVYNALLHRQHRVPVHSILLLLRREARLSTQDGNIQYAPRPGRGKMDFAYEVIPLWERSVEVLLAGGLGALPLAPLCRLPAGMSLEDGARWAVERMAERLRQEAAPEVSRRLETAALLLTGLRFTQEQALAIFQGVRAMRESSTYQMILDEGRIEGAQRLLLGLGREKFGEPDAAMRRVLTQINDLDRLDRMNKQVLKASTWDELLQTP
jgi:hypothetical protein